MKTRILTMAMVALLGFSQFGCLPLLVAAGAGAAGGQAIGHNTESTLIGTALGVLGKLALDSETAKYQTAHPLAAPVVATPVRPAMKPDCSRLYTAEERTACKQGIADSANRAKKDRLNSAYQYGLGQ